VIVGAMLTQNTLWTNVERAIRNLRLSDSLSIDAIRPAERRELELLVRPSGYFRQKAKRLQAFVAFIDER
jgi:endonuclease-3 related protein